MFPPGPCLV
nr:unnamed protein product [Callosobruchus analis]